MSSSIIDGLVLPENIIRDFMYTHDGTAIALAIDVGVQLNICGLDLYIRNRGAAALTIAINGQNVITVDAGDVYVLNNTKFWLIEIVSAVIYDFQLFGVKYTTLKRRGFL